MSKYRSFNSTYCHHHINKWFILPFFICLFVCSKAVLKQRCWKFLLLRNSENYAFILSVNRQKEEPCITLFQIAPCRNHVRPIKDEPTSFRSVSILIPSVCMFPTDFMLAGKKRHYTSVNEAKCCLKKLPASWQNSFAPEEKKKSDITT